MQTVLPAEFKRGMLLLLDNIPHFIEDSHTSGTAQTRHKLHVRLRNLKTSHIIDRTFAENERVAVAQVEHRMVQFSYKQGDTYAFVDTQSFEELDQSGRASGRPPVVPQGERGIQGALPRREVARHRPAAASYVAGGGDRATDSGRR